MDTIAYVDCSVGVSGDLLLSALLDAGLSLARLQDVLTTVAMPGTYCIEPLKVQRPGLSGSAFSLAVQDTGAQRSLAEWRDHLLQVATLPVPVRENTLRCLQCLLEAEATVSNTTVATLRVSSATVLELLAVVAGLHELKLMALYFSPLPLTHGFVEKEQQLLPLLSPVSLEILRPHPVSWKPSTLSTALVTPVGAALLATFARFDPPVLSIERTGSGLGETEQNWSGALRIYLGRAQTVAEPDFIQSGQGADTDWVAVIETHIDTMTGELLGGLMERLFAAGALDVTYTPIQMKKNRPATLLTVISPLDLGEQLALLLLRETTTLGVRIQHIRRLKAQREQIQVETELGPMLVKVKRLGGQVIHVAPEYEECQRVARAHNIPLAAAYEVARDAIKSVIIG
ncbi:UPF0272 protein [Dictyobacter kobayashii]|uniref:UPF0272 protein n=2 Tax=Dictyobacter kobayashii TaxID=2014872 RepID=A0A402AN76_9CHLR|nr:UPF0272 protein [Dictyobacter kobayashii]